MLFIIRPRKFSLTIFFRFGYAWRSLAEAASGQMDSTLEVRGERVALGKNPPELFLVLQLLFDEVTYNLLKSKDTLSIRWPFFYNEIIIRRNETDIRRNDTIFRRNEAIS